MNKHSSETSLKNKRPLEPQDNPSTDHIPPKKSKHDDICVLKEIIIRNDVDPHIYIRIDCTYVKIGKFVYKTKPFEDLGVSTIGDFSDKVALNLYQYLDVKEYITGTKVMVNSFYQRVPTISNMKINLHMDSNFKNMMKRGDIIAYIEDVLHNQIVCSDQNFTISYKDARLTVNIDDLDGNIMGKVRYNTSINFKHIGDNITIYEDCIELNGKAIMGRIIRCISLNGSSLFPLIIDRRDVGEYLRRALPQTFTDGDRVSYSNLSYEFVFSIGVISHNKKTKYRNIYTLSEDEEIINIESDTNDVIITHDWSEAKKISFSCNPVQKQEYKMDDFIIDTDDLISHIKENIQTLAFKQTFKVRIENKQLLLKINYINPFQNLPTMYKLVTDQTESNNTKIVFDSTNTKSKFILVKNKEPRKIDRITFKIKKVVNAGLLAFLVSSSEKSKIFDSKKLEKIVRNNFPSRTAVGHRLEITYENQDYGLLVKELCFVDGGGTDDVGKESIIDKKRHPTCGWINDETEFKFELSKHYKMSAISDKKQSEMLSNPITELEKCVGGVSEQLKKIVRTICLSRGKMKEEFDALELKPAKGIIFYGSPGTGKTTLARNIGKLFGCEGERFRLMSGPEVFQKYVGESESNVRNIFRPAKEAWKKHGKQSPLYMVVIDEIDAMIPARSGSGGHPVRDSVVNQFLAELDGLEQFDNFICIGITNRLELLDPAAIRPGRLGIHIKIDLPDKAGRLKIFEIHTKKLRELNKLDKIDFNKLSEITDDFSGADIERVVEAATTYYLERLDEGQDLGSEGGNMMIGEKDFLDAVKELRLVHNDDKDIVSHIYL